ncbi:MAG TPA: molybdopterin molybdotransferase MoeA, partial [Polyangia bacterium]
ENAKQGTVLVSTGTVLGALHIGACAAAGRAHVYAVRSPRVAVMSTGRELLTPGTATEAHQERDSNGPMVTAALTAAGFSVIATRRVADDQTAIVGMLRELLAQSDAVVVSGGVSVGAYDLVPAALAAIEARTLVRGVAMKPGKPFLFATAPHDRCIFGLPGNPLSAATGLHEFVLPALRRCAGWPEPGCRPLVRARLRETVAGLPGQQRAILGVLEWTATGPEVTPLLSQSSADLAAGARADGAILVPAETPKLEAGGLVDFRPWRAWP